MNSASAMVTKLKGLCTMDYPSADALADDLMQESQNIEARMQVFSKIRTRQDKTKLNGIFSAFYFSISQWADKIFRIDTSGIDMY